MYKCTLSALERWAPHLGPHALQRALRWERYLEAHARRIYGLATDYRLLAAQSLGRRIKSGDLEDGFSQRDVRRKGWSYLGDDELVHAACQELAAAGWIRSIKAAEPSGPGRPGSPTYEINPKLKQRGAGTN